MHAEGGGRVLSGEQSGAVGGSSDLRCHSSSAATMTRWPRVPPGTEANTPASVEQPLEQGPVDGVTALRVAELVRDDEAHLLLVEQVEQARS